MPVEIEVDGDGFVLHFRGTRHVLQYRLTDAEAVRMARDIIHRSTSATEADKGGAA